MYTIKLLKLIYNSEPRVASEMLLGYIEKKLRDGEYAGVDRLLPALEPFKLAPETILTALTITWHAKEFLNERDDFLLRCETALQQKLGKERVEKLLANRR